MKRAQPFFTSAALGLLLLSPLIFPIPYGANRPGGALRIQIIGFLVLALATLGAREGPRLRLAWIPVVLTVLLIVLGIVQIVPLPSGMLESLSPRSVRTWTEASTVLSLFDRPAPDPRISIVPWETLQQTILLAAWLSLFIGAFMVGRERPRAPRWIVLALALTGAIHALHGTILIRFPQTADAFGDRAHGTFINPNHFAAYLNICLAAAFALLLVEILYALTGHRPRKVSNAQVVLGFFLTTTVVLIIGAAILLSQSRGGIAAGGAMLGLMTVAVLFHPRVRTKRRSLVAGLLLAAMIIGVGSVILSDRSALYRFLSVDPRDPASNTRTQYWGVAIDAWREYPVFGSGLGTFRESFRQVQPYDERATYITHAHNDPIELLVTGGAVGFAIGALGILSVLVLLARSWWRERHREPSVWILASIGAVVAVSLHSLVEFPFTIPAIPALLAVLVGAGWSAAAE